MSDHSGQTDGRFFGALFPTPFTAFIFVSYIILFINQGILVTATKSSDNKFNYSTIAVVLLTECLKLIISIGIYFKDKEAKSGQLVREIVANWKIMALYLVPAFLYCLYNNLSFINLASYDPTTYYLLLQLRVAVTGVIYQFLFKRILTKSQWFSLILLTIGCIVKQFGGSFNGGGKTTTHSLISFNLLLILVQVFCSCFAGVYNEYLLKDIGSKVHIMVQNIFMYFDSILCNLSLLVLSGEMSRLSELSDSSNILSDPKIIAIMVNNAFCGIITSFFLKNLNSILKTFAAALELVFTAILCFLIFDIPIDIYTVIAIGIVWYSTFLYSRNPVINANNASNGRQNNDIKYSLLNEKQSSIV